MCNRTTGTLPPVVAESLATIALGLLAASGLAKLADPDPTTGAMRSARMPATPAITYGLGLTELAVGVAALILGGLWLLPGAVLYAGFAAFTFAALRNRIPVQSCGCFGRDDTPPSRLHVGYNLVATIAIAAVATRGVPPVNWDAPVIEVLLYVGFAAIGVACSYLLLARLPQLMAQIENA